MDLVIWNQIETDTIDISIDGDDIVVKLNDIEHKRIPFDADTFSEILNDVEKINKLHIEGDDENFHKLSEDLLQKMEAMV